MCSQFMQQSMRSTICLVGIMLHVRDAKRKLQKRKINTLVENANSLMKNTRLGQGESLRGQIT